MKRRRFLEQTALAGGILALHPADLFAAVLQQPSYKLKMLRNNVGVFTEQGGTIAYLLSPTGTAVVDAEFPDPAKHLIAELQKQSQQPFRLLINTHHHLDHSSGNISFKGIAEHVLAHANSRANQEKVAVAQKKEDQQLYPDQTFTDTWTTRIDRETISLSYHGAGHTNGDSLVHFEHAGIVHMGDLVFNRRHPYIDRSAGASISNWITILEKAAKEFGRKTIYVFGHAGDGYEITGSAGDLLAFRDYLANLLRFTGSQIKAGKSREEILKATEIPGSPQWKGEGIERPLTAAYEELTERT